MEAAAAVLAGRVDSSPGSDEALRAAAGLIDKSLLLQTDSSVAGRPLYDMLETVRAYAALELATAGERDDALEGLKRYSAAEACLAAEGLAGPAQAEWLDRVREDLESHRVVLAWLIDHDRSAEAVDIALGLMFFWIIRGRATEGQRWGKARCVRALGRIGGLPRTQRGAGRPSIPCYRTSITSFEKRAPADRESRKRGE